MAVTDELRAEIAQIAREQIASGQQPSPGVTEIINSSNQPSKFTMLGADFDSKEAAEAGVAEVMRRLQTENAELKGRAEAAAAPPPTQFVSGNEPVGYRHSVFVQDFTGQDPNDTNLKFNRGIDYALRTGILGPVGEKLPPGAGFELLRQSIDAVRVINQERQREQLEALQRQHPEIPWQNPEAMKLIEETAKKTNMNPGDPQHREAVISLLQVRGAFPTQAQWQQWQQQQQQQPQQPGQATILPMRPQAPPRAPQTAAQNLNEEQERLLLEFNSLIAGKSKEEAEAIHARLQPRLRAAGI